MFIIVTIMAILVFLLIKETKYSKLEAEVLKELGFSNWDIVSNIDKNVIVKSRQALEKYDDIKFFKNDGKLSQAENTLKRKNEVAYILRSFLSNNKYKSKWQYNRLEKRINAVIENARAYRIKVTYISSAGNNLGERIITVNQYNINKFNNDPSLLMGKGE